MVSARTRWVRSSFASAALASSASLQPYAWTWPVSWRPLRATHAAVLGRAELQAILTQFDPARLLPVLHRLATSGLPHQHEVLDTLLAADPSGSGQALCATLQALHSQELLARIFHPDRVQALRHACRPLVQEPA